jgi:hypothetical protein
VLAGQPAPHLAARGAVLRVQRLAKQRPPAARPAVGPQHRLRPGELDEPGAGFRDGPVVLGLGAVGQPTRGEEHHQHHRHGDQHGQRKTAVRRTAEDSRSARMFMS